MWCGSNFMWRRNDSKREWMSGGENDRCLQLVSCLASSALFALKCVEKKQRNSVGILLWFFVIHYFSGVLQERAVDVVFRKNFPGIVWCVILLNCIDLMFMLQLWYVCGYCCISFRSNGCHSACLLYNTAQTKEHDYIGKVLCTSLKLVLFRQAARVTAVTSSKLFSLSAFSLWLYKYSHYECMILYLYKGNPYSEFRVRPTIVMSHSKPEIWTERKIYLKICIVG